MGQRKALHFPHDKDRVGKVLKAYYKIPRYETIYKFLRQLDLKDFAAKLSEWLSAQSGLLPRQIVLTHRGKERARPHWPRPDVRFFSKKHPFQGSTASD